MYSVFFLLFFLMLIIMKGKFSKDNLMLIMTLLTCHMSLERIRNE